MMSRRSIAYVGNGINPPLEGDNLKRYDSDSSLGIDDEKVDSHERTSSFPHRSRFSSVSSFFARNQNSIVNGSRWSRPAKLTLLFIGIVIFIFVSLRLPWRGLCLFS
eukprot:GHVN01076961.1.p1 GENE.GHVN01076961.1~~GHVN01076961.1.p1  ORF type:complete len:107 (+),score=8.21 GHVN01076961.1:187-507(+)